MSDARDERSRTGSGAVWATSIVAALVLYVLSPPAVVKMLVITRGYPPPAVATAIGVIYAPLSWLYENSPLVRRCYDWYGALWGTR
jgi:hypothetical protein